MAHKEDIPTSILETEGNNVKTGALAIFEKRKGTKKIKSIHLHWRLVSYANRTYLLGYPTTVAGEKVAKKFLVKECSIEMNLPEKVFVPQGSSETFFSIRSGEKNIYLIAESKHHRDTWVNAICGVIKGRIVSTTSKDSIDSSDVQRDFHQRLPADTASRPGTDWRSVRNTADTAPRRGTDWRRVNTAPPSQSKMTNRASLSSIPSSAKDLASRPGIDWRSVRNTADTAPRTGADWTRVNTAPPSQSKMTNRASLSSIPSSAKDLALQRQKSTHTASVMAPLQSQQSAVHSLNSADRMRSSSQHEQNNSEIYDDGAQYNGFEKSYYGHEPGYEPLKSDDPKVILHTPSPHYMSLQDCDDRSSVSCVNNLGFARERIYDDSVAPLLPERDYQTPTSVVQEALVKKTSIKKTRAPQPPKAPMDRMDHQPIGRDKSDDDNEKEMKGEKNIEAQHGESIHDYIQRFRSELFQKDGFIVEVDKTDLSPETITLTCVADCICIAALLNAKLHSLLHVDDVIVKVNQQTLSSIDFCYNLFRTTDENKVLLHVKRVMHGTLCHVILPANGDVDSLGLEFGDQSQGNMVTTIRSDGLVAKSGSPSRPQANGVGGMPVNWGLVEINQSPVPFNSSPADVRDQIQHAGIELALVFIPMDIINIFKEKPCEESTEQRSEGEGRC